MVFDRPTNYGRSIHRVNEPSEHCNEVISGVYYHNTSNTLASPLSNMGGIGSCVWTSEMMLELRMGSYTPLFRMVRPGDAIIVFNVLTRAENSRAINSSHRHVIGPPPVIPSPQLVMKAPSIVSQCDGAVIDIGQSTGNAGRPWTSLHYSVASTPGMPSPIRSVLDGLQAQLDSFSGYQNAVDLVDVILYGGFSFDFTVTVTNYLGGTSNATKTITKSLLSTPSVMINGKSDMSMMAANRLSLDVDATFASCFNGSKSMKYQWTMVEMSLVGNEVMLDKTARTRKLSVSPHSLQPQQRYRISVLGYMETDERLRNTAEVTPVCLFMCVHFVTCFCSNVSAGDHYRGDL
eukprot:SAG31_NODE_445_length_15593_cov_8.514974_2_plen_348_part_00